MTTTPFSGSSAVRSHGFDLLGAIRRRILLSIAASAGWLSLVLLFLAFGATGLSLFQDIVVIVVSLIVLAAVIVASWISFGLRFTGGWGD